MASMFSVDLPVGPEGQRPDRHGLHRHAALHPPDDQHQELHPGSGSDEEHLSAALPGGEQDAIARQQGEPRLFLTAQLNKDTKTTGSRALCLQGLNLSFGPAVMFELST